MLKQIRKFLKKCQEKRQIERQKKWAEIYEWRVQDTMEELGLTREEAIKALMLGW